MKSKFLIVIFFAIAALTVSAKVNVENLFSYENATFAGLNLNYRVAEKGDSAQIVVIYLHGGSGQGDDNNTQMKNPAIADIYNYLNAHIEGFTFIVPQAPYGQQWMGLAIPALKELLDKYSDNGNKDTYILGGSMGSAGTWNMLLAYPGYFKGAMPVAFDTPRSGVDKYLGTRIYSVVGGNDRRRNIGKSKSFFEKLTKQGGNARLDVENSWGHRQTCEWSFTPDRLAWLFEQKFDDCSIKSSQ